MIGGDHYILDGHSGAMRAIAYCRSAGRQRRLEMSLCSQKVPHAKACGGTRSTRGMVFMMCQRCDVKRYHRCAFQSRVPALQKFCVQRHNIAVITEHVSLRPVTSLQHHDTRQTLSIRRGSNGCCNFWY